MRQITVRLSLTLLGVAGLLHGAAIGGVRCFSFSSSLHPPTSAAPCSSRSSTWLDARLLHNGETNRNLQGCSYVLSLSQNPVAESQSERAHEAPGSHRSAVETGAVLNVTGTAPLHWWRGRSTGTSGLLSMVRKSLERLPLRVGPSKKPLRVGSLILLRCGESASYADQIFTGWDDPDLTRKGIEQSQRAGQLLVMHGLDEMVDVVYASVLKRSVKSAFVVLQTTNSAFVPVKKRWRLNQRHYGAAQGLSKREAASQLGETVVRSWRNTLKAKPPPLSELDPSHPRHDRRYREVLNEKESNSLPSSESLLDCQRRATVVWDDEIRELIFRGKTVLVVAHRDTLLGIMRALDDLTESDLRSVRIPRGVPILYRFEASARARGGEYDLVPKPASAHGKQEAVQLVNRTSAVYLEQPKQLHVELQRDLEWTNLRFLATTGEDENKGANDSSLREREGEVSAPNARLRNQTLVSRVQQLRAESNLLHTSNEISSEEAASPSVVDESVEATSARPAEETSGPWASVRWTDDPSEFEDYDEFNDLDDTEDGGASSLSEVLASSTLPSSADSRVAPVVLPVPDSASSPSSSWPHDHAYIVLIRHGRTPHNNLGLFTGWEDPPLAPDGIEDAKRAGRLLRRHGFEFDVVYTSWLTRAIQTAFYVMDELDCTWLPLVKSWRLNERMYGALTGKSKRQIEAEYGGEQLKIWRRGYEVRPPPVSVYSPSYPGNDRRRAKHFAELPVSIKETFFRSLEGRKFAVHRKFPRAESLKCCMERTIPFYSSHIGPDAVDRGKRVLVASHENAIRGILMHLCDIPESAMNQLHLPNGLPLVYNVRGKCISLLEEGDEGDGDGPAPAHDFGPAAQYLFRPCQIDDDFYDGRDEPGS